MRRLLLLVVLILCGAGCAPPSWWTFRSDDAGTASNPKENTITAANVAKLHQVWQQPNPTSDQPDVPLTAGGVVFLVEQSQVADSGTVIALDLTSGAAKWTHTYPHRLQSYGLVGSNLLLSYDDAHASGVLAVTQAAGASVWQATVDDGVYPTGGAVSGDGRVYAPFSDNLYAFDAATGRQLWHYSCASFSCSGDPSAGIAFANHRVYLGGDNGFAGAAVDAATGRVLTSFAGPISEWYGQPVVSGGLVVFPGENSTGRGASAGQVTAFAAGCTAAVCKSTWSVNLTQPVARLAVENSIVYARAAYENVDAFALASGHRVWHGALPPVGTGSAVNNVAVAGNVVYVTSGSALYAFAANGCAATATCAPTWSPHISNSTYILAQWNAPVVSGGRLLYVDQVGLHAFGLS